MLVTVPIDYQSSKFFSREMEQNCNFNYAYQHNQNSDQWQQELVHVNNFLACLSQKNSSKLSPLVRVQFNYNRFTKIPT